MVEVTVDVAADAALRDEIVGWIARFPRTDELQLRHADSVVTATLHSPPQLATLVMAIAMFLRTKPAEQRPAANVTATNGESIEVTTHPDANAIRSVYIAMDRQPPPVVHAITAEVVDAEVIEPSELHQGSTNSANDD